MILFTHGRIFDGSGAAPFDGDLLIHGNRIEAVRRAGDDTPLPGDVRRVDATGCTLMPGLTEAHAHLSWPSSVERFVPGMNLPPDELVSNTAQNARILLDHGFTSAYSAGALEATLEMDLKAQIDGGALPGPRLVPSSIEREPPNESAFLQAGSVAEHGRGPHAVRAFVKLCAARGAKVVKFLLSGESALKPGASHEILYTEEEIRAAGEQARASNVWLSGHAHAAEAIKMGIRHGFRVLYHCTYADDEAIDLLVEHRDRMFVGPTLGIVQATLDATPPPHVDMRHMKADAAVVLERQRQLAPRLKARGVRLVPGGDYGFPFNPNGRNARDLELFVRHLGFTPVEVLRAATQLGGEIMGLPEQLGQLKAGYLADVLMVAGDPTQDIGLLQQKDNLRAIVKDGRFHKAPAGLA